MNRLLSAVYSLHDVIVPKITSFLCGRVQARMWRHYLANTRPSSGQNMPKPGRYPARLVKVYHESSGSAGIHIESYIDDGKTAYNIGVKRLPEPLKRKNGRLTEASKAKVNEIFHREFAQRGFVAQSTDHTSDQARCEWFIKSDGPTGYGAGATRQVVSDTPIYVKAEVNKAMFVDYDINPNQQIFIYKVFPKTNILSVGYKQFDDPKFNDRLHLKIVPNQETFIRKLGPNPVTTIKVDGASCHWILDKSGFRAWSPRISKETGHRIEYTNKLGELTNARSIQSITGMGELTFRTNPPRLWWLALPDSCGRVLSHSEIGGILNADALPQGVTPNLMVYRIDSIDKEDMLLKDYRYNLNLCKDVAKKSKYFSAPREISVNQISHLCGEEGVVGVRTGESIVDGLKFKFMADPLDWILDSIDLRPGDKGGISGVAWFKSRGHRFKIGASSLGTRDQVVEVMKNPDKFIGRTYEVSGFLGHEGRAARLVYGINQPHLCK